MIARRAGPAGLLLLAGAVLATRQAAAQSPLTTGPDCGGDAYSSGQVIEKRPARRGPLTAVPDTLCADVAPQGPGTPVEIGIYPGVGGAPMPPRNVLPPRDGGPGFRDPYEDRPPRYRAP